MSEENWEQFFKEAGIENEWVTHYSRIFKDNSINYADVKELTRADFMSMKITKIGHIMNIERKAKQIQTIQTTSESRTRQDESENSENIKRPRLIEPEKKSPNRFLHLIGKSYFFDKSLIIEQIIKQTFLNRSRLIDWDSPITAPDMFIDYSEVCPADPVYLVGPRRFGKTTVLHMLWAFFNGDITEEKLIKLQIYSNKEAMAWYDKFCVIYVTFGNCSGVISSEKDCVEACRNILYTAFNDYSYLISSLEGDEAILFKKWTNHSECIKLSKEDVCSGLKFLVDCMLIANNYEKRCLLLIDEYDRICAKALFKVDENTLDRIVGFYSDMVGQSMKHSSNCFGIFTGVTAVTCTDQSSLNNMEIIHVLRDETFFQFYGITTTEFTNFLNGSTIPAEIQSLADLATSYYNGYCLGNVSLLNVYSIRRFIKFGKVTEYWKESGFSIGLHQAVRCKSWRQILIRLMNREKFTIKYIESIRAATLDRISDQTYEIVDFSVMWNLLLQQGYLNVIQVLEDKKHVIVQIPNTETELELRCRLLECFQKKFNFDPERIEICRSTFLSIDITNSIDCENKLGIVKLNINEMLNGFKKKSINEAWFEAFLFYVFIESFHIDPQKKVEETATNNDNRTAKVLDLFVQASDKCFVFEESLQDSAEKTLQKLLDKKYYIPAQNSGLPFLLIAFSVIEDNRGYALVDICYLRNTITGQFEEV